MAEKPTQPPPAPAEPAAPPPAPGQLGLADMTAEQAVAAVSNLQPWLLDNAASEEEAGKGRKTVLDAIERVRAAVPTSASPDMPAPTKGPTYSADELAAVAEARFGVPGAVVRGAFLAKGVTHMPLAEAEALVGEYAAYRPPIPGQQEA